MKASDWIDEMKNNHNMEKHNIYLLPRNLSGIISYPATSLISSA